MLDLHAFRRRQAVAYPDVVLALAHAAVDFFRLQDVQLEMHAGFRLAELADQARQQLAAEGLVGRDLHHALADPGSSPARPIAPAPHPDARAAHRPPSIGRIPGQHHAPGVAVEQHGTVFVLQLADHAADGRRRQCKDCAAVVSDPLLTTSGKYLSAVLSMGPGGRASRGGAHYGAKAPPPPSGASPGSRGHDRRVLCRRCRRKGPAAAPAAVSARKKSPRSILGESGRRQAAS